MLGSVAFRSPPLQPWPAYASEPAGAALSPRAARASVVCGERRSHTSIPKLEPFSRSRIERWIEEPALLQKTENDLTDYCTTLEGDDSYSCWKAYFELKDLEQDLPTEDVEKLVRQAGGIKSLIHCLHCITAIERKKDNEVKQPKAGNTGTREGRPFPVPDGLPPTAEELEEAENARMPDSPFTRLLRSKGRFPAWYTRAPDHETD